MNKLTFPTQAEIALARAKHKGRSIATIARELGAEVKKTFEGKITYTFDDDSSIETKGHGQNYKLEVFLP